ncbi:MAG: GNAT family N-acetyltransferase [Actinomycetes bacterium]
MVGEEATLASDTGRRPRRLLCGMISIMTGSEASIRDATISDRDAVWLLVRDFAMSSTPDRATFDESFTALHAEPNMLLCVAESGEVVIGYLVATSHLTLFANGPVCWIEEVMVSPEHRRAGVGAALMNAAERWAETLGAAYVSLATRRAGDFYRALGYEDSAVFFKKSPG